MTQPDFRELCAELVDELNYHADEHSVDKLISRARTALATPPPEPPSEEDLLRLWQFNFGKTPKDRFMDIAHFVLALAATPPPEPPTVMEALAARPLLEQVARLGDCIGANTVGKIMAISSRAAAWLEANPPGQPVAIEPRGCPTPGACSCVEPATPPSEPPTDQELEPSFSQRQQLLHGMMRCLCQSSVHDYLKVWIRDYTRAALERWGR